MNSLNRSIRKVSQKLSKLSKLSHENEILSQGVGVSIETQPQALSESALEVSYSLSRLIPTHQPIKDPLRKHAYSNILKISPPKTESFQIKNSDIFHISAQNIDCATR